MATHFDGGSTPTSNVVSSQSGLAALIGSSNKQKSNLANPLDRLSSADIAVFVARSANMPEQVAITNQADSVSAAVATSTVSSTNVVSKPQIVATSFKSNKDIKTYVTKQGDTVSGIAAQFGITSESVRYSNDLDGDSVPVGTALTIPPVNGMVYVVKPGDTPESLASRYGADAKQIIAYNDAEIKGLSVGTKIILPNGKKPAPAVARITPSYGSWGGGTATYGYNGYDYGYCTWYVADKRIANGSPVPTNLGNGGQWATNAVRYGLATGKTPQVGAAAVTDSRNPGHVVYVEQINADGSIWISEMNSSGQVSMTNPARAGGWGRVDFKIIPADRANSLNYVY